MEESGRALACVPLLSTCVLATGALLISGDESAARTYLPGIAEGTTIATVALLDDTDSLTADAVHTRAQRSATVSPSPEPRRSSSTAPTPTCSWCRPHRCRRRTVRRRITGRRSTRRATRHRSTRPATSRRSPSTTPPATLVGTDGDGWSYIEAVLDLGPQGWPPNRSAPPPSAGNDRRLRQGP